MLFLLLLLLSLAAFEDFAKSMDNLCGELITKAENTARELERTRYAMPELTIYNVVRLIYFLMQRRCLDGF
jgi:hypothetical protein